MSDEGLNQLNAAKKTKRNKRLLKITDEVIKQIQDSPFVNSVIYSDKTKIEIDTVKGVFDFFPKSDRLLWRDKNKWFDNAFSWIKKSFLNNETHS